MIYTVTDFVLLGISILLIFLIFCLSNFINNSKSPVDIILQSNLAVYSNKVSSPHSPDREKPFLSISRLRLPLLKCRKATVAKLK